MNKIEIEDIIRLFSQENVNKLSIAKGDFSLNLEKENPLIYDNEIGNLEKSKMVFSKADDDGANYEVRSILAGIYYEAPSPESEAYVKVGDFVEKDEIICIIEAMKMINEIRTPVSGTIKKINFNNEELVEYDDVIMEIEENV